MQVSAKDRSAGRDLCIVTHKERVHLVRTRFGDFIRLRDGIVNHAALIFCSTRLYSRPLRYVPADTRAGLGRRAHAYVRYRP